MSISHQRRQGEGTVDGQTLDWAKRSDLYKLAREHYPTAVLIPFQESWEIGINENPQNDLALGGLYFGKWVVNHNSQDVGDTDNSRKRSQSFLKFGDKVVVRTMILIHGDDILVWKTAIGKHLGSATSLHVHKLEEDDQPQHGVQVSFIGYKVTNQADFTPPTPNVNMNVDNDGKVHLSVSDLTNLGYTYVWSVTTGSGTFVNPTNPNVVFVPDGNGNYVIRLVVTDGDGNVSLPVDTDVKVFRRELSVTNGETVSAYVDGADQVDIANGLNIINIDDVKTQYIKNKSSTPIIMLVNETGQPGSVDYLLEPNEKGVITFPASAQITFSQIPLWELTVNGLPDRHMLFTNPPFEADIAEGSFANWTGLTPRSDFHVIGSALLSPAETMRFTDVDGNIVFTTALGDGSFDFTLPYRHRGYLLTTTLI
ncbi:hypothetical protein CA265_09385 [Sphingobacteriaceae bacterium GW460-11-11-14-LB5]|nr:hypothetical protein CA265_09385 [Sphingobacteriaceae bacterium GW460-11-11-14-LB5]